MPMGRTRVLFFAEAVTLAHVARPVALGRSLDSDQYEVVIACPQRYAPFAQSPRWRLESLESIPPEQFNAALARGSPVYDSATLRRYAEEDLALFDRVAPDLVVGDFRLSLSASARVAGIPYLTIANAYWSPDYRGAFPLPVLPMTRVLPLPVARQLFSAFRPLAFGAHCRPMNRLRAGFGLPGFGNDLRRVYTDADHHLVPDIESLYPLERSSRSHSFLGALAWSPPVEKPDWWDGVAAQNRPIVYVTLGSSGSARVLQRVLDALSGQPISVIASSAGASRAIRVPVNAKVADYLPGEEAAARSALVVCNGGSLGTQQGLAAGVPVLGIASNMDQFFNMEPLVRQGAARLLRADRLTDDRIRDACRFLLTSTSAREAAARVQAMMGQSRPAAETFDDAATQLLQGRQKYQAANS